MVNFNRGKQVYLLQAFLAKLSKTNFTSSWKWIEKVGKFSWKNLSQANSIKLFPDVLRQIGTMLLKGAPRYNKDLGKCKNTKWKILNFCQYEILGCGKNLERGGEKKVVKVSMEAQDKSYRRNGREDKSYRLHELPSFTVQPNLFSIKSLQK